MKLDNQNSEKSLQLLAAKDYLYSSAANWSYLVYISALAPLVFQFLKLQYAELKDWEYFVNTVGIALVFAIGYLIKNRIQSATTLYEEFDTDLFQLPWHDAISGQKISPEDRRRMAGNEKNQLRFQNWYAPAELEKIEHSIAVLLCQRQNVHWDLHQKRRFTKFLGWVLFLSIVAVLGWGLHRADMSYWDWIIWGLFPVSAFLVKTWMLYRDFKSVTGKQESLATDIAAAWEEYRVSGGTVSTTRLRHFQDRILDYRKENTIVPGWLYGWFKSDDQKFATAATLELIMQALPSQKN